MLEEKDKYWASSKFKRFHVKTVFSLIYIVFLIIIIFINTITSIKTYIPFVNLWLPNEWKWFINSSFSIKIKIYINSKKWCRYCSYKYLCNPISGIIKNISSHKLTKKNESNWYFRMYGIKIKIKNVCKRCTHSMWARFISRFAKISRLSNIKWKKYKCTAQCIVNLCRYYTCKKECRECFCFSFNYERM